MFGAAIRKNFEPPAMTTLIGAFHRKICSHEGTFSWLPCFILSCIRFSLTAYWNMMRYPLLAALPPPVLVSYWRTIQIWCTILFSLPCLLLFSFLIEELFKYGALSSLGCPASSSPVFASYSIPIVIWFNILSSLHCLLLCSFLIKSLFKYDAISSPSCLAHIRNYVKDNAFSMNWFFVLYK